jgi:hypothetical protein
LKVAASNLHFNEGSHVMHSVRGISESCLT